MRSRLSLIIPLLLFMSALISSAVIFYWETAAAEKHIRRDALQQLNLDITRLQNIMYNRLIEGDVTVARMSLSVSAMDQAINSLLLTDEDDRVIIANRYTWQGKAASAVSGYVDELARNARQNNTPELFYPEATPSILTAYYPVVLRLGNQQGRSIKHRGVLYAEYSIVEHQLIARQEAINLAIGYLVMMLVMTLVVASLMHIIITKRLAELTRAAKTMSAGDLAVHVNVSGHDEISTLASSFNEMAGRIKSDIQRREMAEQELLELNQSLEQRIDDRTGLLIEAQRIAHLGNWVVYVNDKAAIWSEEVYRILGFEPGEIVASDEIMKRYIHPDDLDRFETAHQKALRSNTSQSLEFRIIRQDQTERWVSSSLVVTLDKEKRPLTYKGTLQDITERKQEREQHAFLEKQLQQTQKMESLGQLTGGIAHDFNNMLAAIIGFTDLAKGLNVTDNSGKLEQYLDIVMQSSERAKSLVTQMLTFSRTHENLAQKEKILVTDFLEESFRLLKPIIPSSIELVINKPDGDFYIMANSIMLGQVFMNLCVNARDAIESSQGKIVIDVETVEINQVACDSCHQTIIGEFVQINVRDTGKGIDDNLLNNIFEPFFTTKEIGKGTGMGLAMIHGIMHKHDGHVLVNSVKGEGTSFSLLFPVIATADIEQYSGFVAGVQKEMESGQGERILVVDDEVSITIFLAEYLTEKGFDVITMNDSKEALSYFIQHHNDLDLVITDYTMPGITGMQMALSMLDEVPDFPIVLCTGYSDYINEENALENNIKGFLTKPVDMGKLVLYIKQFARRHAGPRQEKISQN